jgi:hypothetical protein
MLNALVEDRVEGSGKAGRSAGYLPAVFFPAFASVWFTSHFCDCASGAWPGAQLMAS